VGAEGALDGALPTAPDHAAARASRAFTGSSERNPWPAEGVGEPPTVPPDPDDPPEPGLLEPRGLLDGCPLRLGDGDGLRDGDVEEPAVAFGVGRGVTPGDGRAEGPGVVTPGLAEEGSGCGRNVPPGEGRRWGVGGAAEGASAGDPPEAPGAAGEEESAGGIVVGAGVGRTGSSP